MRTLEQRPMSLPQGSLFFLDALYGLSQPERGFEVDVNSIYEEER